MKTFLLIVAEFFCIHVISQGQSFTIQQVHDSLFVVATGATVKKKEVTWTISPDTWKPDHRLAIKSDHDTTVIGSSHPILKLKSSTGKSMYTAPREIKLQGAINFRDLGGYRTSDGHEVKWGKIYRSADISKLTDSDLQKLMALNVKMVCDLRGEKEITDAPDRLPAEAKHIDLTAGSENMGGFRESLTSSERADSMMRAFYGRTDHLGKKYKPVFDELLHLEPDQALLFHCTAGKDRTGIGAAFILYALGVPEMDIYKDYELTNEYRKASNEQALKGMTAHGIPESAARTMMTANPAFLKATFDAIKKQYGTTDAFFEKELGVTADVKQKLRSKFLYP
jgi:protein-tyrosine phosphatase